MCVRARICGRSEIERCIICTNLDWQGSLELLLVSHGTRSQVPLLDGCAGHDVEFEDVDW